MFFFVHDLIGALFFPRFDHKESISGVNNVKSSVQKGIRNRLLEQMPHIEPFLEEILPKKEPLRVAKWWLKDLVLDFRECKYFCFSHDHIEVFIDKNNCPTFFKQRDGPLYPTLRLLHKCKFICRNQGQSILSCSRAYHLVCRSLPLATHASWQGCHSLHLERCEHYVSRLDVARREDDEARSGFGRCESLDRMFRPLGSACFEVMDLTSSSGSNGWRKGARSRDRSHEDVFRSNVMQ